MIICGGPRTTTALGKLLEEKFVFGLDIFVLLLELFIFDLNPFIFQIKACKLGLKLS